MRDWVVAPCIVGIAVLGCGTTTDIQGAKTDAPRGPSSGQAGTAGAPSAATGGRPISPGGGGSPGCAGSSCDPNGGVAGCGGVDCTVATGGAAVDAGGAGRSGPIADAAPPARDAGPLPCRPDLCLILSNCCAPNGTCGNDLGEGCISNGQQPAVGEVTVDLVTVTASGKFAPRNAAAIWVQTPPGKFEKTLSEYGRVTAQSLVYWTSVSGSNTVDAVTGATRAGHGPLHATWDCTDTLGAEVPNGTYEVCATFAEAWCNSNPSPCPSSLMECVAFAKGPGPSTVHRQDTANFTGFVVTYR